MYGLATTKHSLEAKVVWDPSTRRPHLLMEYVLGTRSRPLQELLLNYGERYWPVGTRQLRRAHGEYAARAAEAIHALLVALRQARVPEAALAACLAPVDLASQHHCFCKMSPG